jgi:hypothetical protein
MRPRFMGSRANEPPLEEGIVDKYKLNDPTRFVPIALGAGVFSTLTGLYHFNAESQILGLFILFTGTVYAKGGDAIGRMLDDTADAILKEQNALEDAQIAATKLVVEAHKRQATVFSDIQEIFEGQKSLMDQIVASHNLKLKHEVRNRIARQLEHAAVVDEQFFQGVKSKMVDAATDYVRSSFEDYDDEELKAKALNASLAQMKDRKAVGQTPVADLFQSFFVKTKSELAALKTAEVSVSAAEQEEALEVARAAARRDGLEGIELVAPKTFILGNKA